MNRAGGWETAATGAGPMKTAYELAMERLNRAAPMKKLSEEQKKELAELDALYSAKIAEREIYLKAELAKAQSSGDLEGMEKWQKQLAEERRTLQAELEAKKEQARAAHKG
jgi:hypothetical protein